jgi:hypothetical protein
MDEQLRQQSRARASQRWATVMGVSLYALYLALQTLTLSEIATTAIHTQLQPPGLPPFRPFRVSQGRAAMYAAQGLVFGLVTAAVGQQHPVILPPSEQLHPLQQLLLGSVSSFDHLWAGAPSLTAWTAFHGQFIGNTSANSWQCIQMLSPWAACIKLPPLGQPAAAASTAITAFVIRTPGMPPDHWHLIAICNPADLRDEAFKAQPLAPGEKPHTWDLGHSVLPGSRVPWQSNALAASRRLARNLLESVPHADGSPVSNEQLQPSANQWAHEMSKHNMQVQFNVCAVAHGALLYDMQSGQMSRGVHSLMTACRCCSRSALH